MPQASDLDTRADRAPGARARAGTEFARFLVNRLLIKRYAGPILFRRPHSVLAPEHLYAYLDALWTRRELDGAIVEVGAYLGGTAAIAYKLLANTAFRKRYLCVDTFEGFVSAQFNPDAAAGMVEATSRWDFSANSLATVKRLLRYWGCEEIELVQADIASLPDESLPDTICVSLLDVDLSVPTYEGLRRIVPRLANGGIVLVDDCVEHGSWAGALDGYRRFVREHDLPERYVMRMGVVER